MTANLLPLAARILISFLFVRAGISTLSSLTGSADYFAMLGFPFPTLVAWGVGLFELGAGLLVVAGLQTRPAAFLLALFALSAGYIGHYGRGDDPVLAFMHEQAFMKDLAIAGGLMALAAHGAGAFSLDAWLQRARSG